jgi:hypothetical protein
MVFVGKKGRIRNGAQQGWYVLVSDDSDSTGGYIIVTSADADLKSGFDDWVEDAPSLEQYFRETGWDVEWIE